METLSLEQILLASSLPIKDRKLSIAAQQAMLLPSGVVNYNSLLIYGGAVGAKSGSHIYNLKHNRTLNCNATTLGGGSSGFHIGSPNGLSPERAYVVKDVILSNSQILCNDDDNLSAVDVFNLTIKGCLIAGGFNTPSSDPDADPDRLYPNAKGLLLIHCKKVRLDGNTFIASGRLPDLSDCEEVVIQNCKMYRFTNVSSIWSKSQITINNCELIDLLPCTEPFFKANGCKITTGINFYNGEVSNAWLQQSDVLPVT